MTGVLAAPTIAHSRAELAAARERTTGTLALVPTMGALHAGHLALVRHAADLADHVAVSIFVNPLQFGPGEDLDRYPRTLDADLELLAREGVALVFAPSAAEMYPRGRPAVTVDPGPLGDLLEGASRPGHFAGVLTVVTKLLGLVRPDVAVFGEKDYQQLALIRRTVADLELGVRIEGAQTVRDPDGLALSSRNRYLTPDQRTEALALSRALRRGAEEGPTAPPPSSGPPPGSCAASRSTTSPCAAPTWARPRTRARPGCSSPPGSARPG